MDVQYGALFAGKLTRSRDGFTLRVETSRSLIRTALAYRPFATS